MAILQLFVPQPYVAAQDSIWITAESDAYTYDNMKYVFNIKNNLTQEIIITTKVFPDISNGWGYYDIHSIVKNLFDYTWLQKYCNSDDLVEHQLDPYLSQGKIEILVEIGEEYYIGQDLTQVLNQQSSTFWVHNYIPRIFERPLSSSNNSYLYNAFNALGNGHYYASHRPRNSNAKIYYSAISNNKDPIYIPYFTDNFSGWNVKTYDANGSLLTNNSMSYSWSPVGTEPTWFQFNFSPFAINNALGSTIVNIDSINYYIVETISGDKFTIYLDCDPDQSAIQLHFMNSYGMFETARFKCANRLMMNVQRKSFERKDVTFETEKVRYAIQKAYNERKINYDGIISHSYKLTMDYITDEEYEWLAELIYSPQVYLYNQDSGMLYPVTIKNTDYEYVKHKYDRLRTLQIDVELNLNKNTFRR